MTKSPRILILFMLSICGFFSSINTLSDVLVGQEWTGYEAMAVYKEVFCLLKIHYIVPESNYESDIKDVSLVFSTDNGKQWKEIGIKSNERPIGIVFDREGNLLLWFDAGIRWKGKPPFTSWSKASGYRLPNRNVSQLTIIKENKFVCCAMDVPGLYEWFISEDCGKSWARLFKSVSYKSSEYLYPPDYIYQEINGQTLFIRLSYKKEKMTFETSEDFGETWHLNSDFTNPNIGVDVVQVLGNTLLFAGTDIEMLSQAVFSLDSGKTWRKTILHTRTQKDFPHITGGFLLDEQRAVVVMSDRLMITTDAGKTWKCVWGPRKKCWLDKSYLSPKGEIWVIGDRILKSIDGKNFKEVKIK